MPNIFDAKKYRFAVFDLDETLLDHGKLSDFTAKTLEKLSDSGVEVIIATGRAFSFVPESITSLPFIRYIISACGACITDMTAKETIWHAPISKEIALEVLELTEKHNAGYGVYYDGLLVHDQISMSYMSLNEPPETIEAIEREFDITVISSARRHIKNDNRPVIKLDCYFRVYSDLRACWDALCGIEGIQLTDSLGICIEITKKGVGKARGLAVLLEKLGGSPENVIAFGDSGNDIDMLEFAGFAVAMGGAVSQVLEKADIVALPASQEGAAKAVLELFSLE